jgi:hypothetical protein
MSEPPAVTGNITQRIRLASIVLVLGCTVSNPAPDTRIPRPPGVDRSATVFRNAVQASYPVPTKQHDRPRPGNCNKCVVMVHIDVLADTRRIDPDQKPAGGVPIAHLRNLDTRDTEAYFGLQPYTVADYYVWVDVNNAGKPRYTLLELVADTVGATRQWNVRLCHSRPSGELPGPSDFDFYEYKHGSYGCSKYNDYAADPGVVVASLFSVAPFRQFFTRISAILHGNMSALQGNWIECSSGCCT